MWLTIRRIMAVIAASSPRSLGCRATCISTFLHITTLVRAYPLVLFFHMASVDEHYFVGSELLSDLDTMIVRGESPRPSSRAPMESTAVEIWSAINIHFISTAWADASRITSFRKCSRS